MTSGTVYSDIISNIQLKTDWVTLCFSENESEVQLNTSIRTTDGSYISNDLDCSFAWDFDEEINVFSEVSPEWTCINSTTVGVIHHDYEIHVFSASATAIIGSTGIGFNLSVLMEIECPEASNVSTNVSAAKMGETIEISIARSNSSVSHELRYYFGGEIRTISADIANYYSWRIPDLAELCNNRISDLCAILCLTFENGEYKGYSRVDVSLTVPDATVPSLPSSITLGSTYAISCKRNSAHFKNRLEFIFKNETVEICDGKVDSQSWTPSYYLAKQIPSLVSSDGTLKCTTLNGTAVVGTKTVSVTVIVPDNNTTKPSISSSGLTLEPVSSLGSVFSGLYIRSKTGLKATMKASSTYSTIAEYSVTAGSMRAIGNPGTIELLADDGNVTVTASVTDARGFSRTVTKTIYVYPYRRPKVVPYTGYSDVICERAKSSGELSPSGTYLAIKAGKSFSAISPSGTNLNHCILRYRWKVSSAADFGSWSTLLDNGSSALEKSLLIGGIVSSLSTSYEVEIQASDALGGVHTLTFAIMTEAISFVLYDGVDGAGFGKYPEEPHVVDIASHMTLRVRGALVVDGTGWKSLGLASGINESAYEVGRYEASGCHYYVDNGNHVYLAFNCAFTYSGTALVINSSAIPSDYRPTRTVYMLCPVNDRYIALISVRTSGYIYVEWVQSLFSGVNTGSASVTWIDGYLDYWL